MLKRKSFCIVCLANYCRSPVLEAFLKERFGEEYEFFSAGLAPMHAPSMDPRSLKYLEENGINNIIHNPKRITKKMLAYFDYFIAIDPFVLNQLNKLYPKHKRKFILARSHIDNINIPDPYAMSDEDYKSIMSKIKIISDTMNLQFI